MYISKLVPYSKAIVAANKLRNSKEIECTPTEELTMLNGDISATVTHIESSGNNASNTPYKTKLQSSITVIATWMPIGNSNRTTAPDVRRGEEVLLYRFADADKFWWTTISDDFSLRRLETVIYAFSGSKVEDVKLDASNTYFIEISTHDGHIHLHTAKGNNEPYGYDIQINTKKGFIQAQDDIGNIFTFNSKENNILMLNADKSLVSINKTNIAIDCTGDVSIKSNSLTITNTTQTQTSSINNTVNANTLNNGSHTTTNNYNGFLNGSISGTDPNDPAG